jgi:hypothetical protein
MVDVVLRYPDMVMIVVMNMVVSTNPVGIVITGVSAVADNRWVGNGL